MKIHFYGLAVGTLLMIVGMLISGEKVTAKPAEHYSLYPPAYQGVDETACANPANPVVAENCLPGTDDWYAEQIGAIEGYASTPSVNKGERVGFFINTTAARFDIYIYRSGYYGGLGGRLIQTIPNIEGKSQPACYEEYDTGLISCANWTETYGLDIPTEWLSGVYIAKLVRQDSGDENYIMFIVRDDERDSDILFQSSTTTFQAYNGYKGRSVYPAGERNACPTITEETRATAVSSNRPYLPQLFLDNYNVYSHGEFAMAYWLESQGYNVTYQANEDTHRSGKVGESNELLDHKVFLSVGHDEYWSQEMRDAITQARDAGVHIGVFSSNTGYWRVRFEPDPITGEPDSTMITYKTTQSGPADPSGIHTGTWRDPNGANNPENALLGSMYIGDNNTRSFPVRVSSEYAGDSIYRHTELPDMPSGSYVNLGKKLIGWEWDGVVDNGLSPEGLEIVAESPVNGEILSMENGRNKYLGVQITNVQMTRYVAESGAIVFNAGTNRWSLGLISYGGVWFEANPLVQQITYNLLADMDVQPTTPAATLILDGDTSGRVIPIEQGGELFTDDGVTPTISNITVTPNEDGATFTWDTDLETNGQIWLARTSGLVNGWSINILEDYTRQHQLTIGGFEPNTTYYYHIVSSDPGERTVVSEEGSFTTLQASGIGKRLRLAAEPIYYPVRCWVIANRTTAIILAAGIGIVALLLIWRGFVWLRRRRSSVRVGG